MFGVRIGAGFITVVLIFSAVIFLITQLLLCFKVKRRIIRLLPVIVLSALTMICIAMSIRITSLDGLLYILLAVFTSFMLLICGIGWGIWAITRFVTKKRGNSKLTE